MTTTTNGADRSATPEQLSALVDGELEDGRVAHACQQWRADGEARAAWHAWHLIGDVLRSDDLAGNPAGDARFLAALRLRLANEPVVLAPPGLAPPSSSVGEVAASAVAAAAGGSVLTVASRSVDLAAARRRRSWQLSSAVAAGFVAVAGVLLVSRAPEDSGRLASAVPASTAPVGAAGGLAAAGPVMASLTTREPAATAATPLGPVAADTASTVDASTAPGRGDARALVASGQLIRDVRLDRYLAAHKEFAGSAALGVPSGFLRNATADAADR